MMRGNVGVSVRFRKGSWWLFVSHRGRRRAKSVGQKRTAEAVAEKLRARLALGDFSIFADQGELLTPYAQRWLKTVEGARKRSTSQFYEFNLRLHILPELGGKPVSAITRADARELLTKCRAKKLGRASLLGVQRTLSAVLSQAVEDGVLAQNPAFRLASKYIGRGDDEKVEVQPASRDEAVRLLDAARDLFPHYRPMFLCALRTGLRLGELLALEWADVDLDGRSLRVRRNRTRGETSSPKSRQARSVDLSAETVTELRALVVRQKADALRLGVDRPALVFTTPKLEAIDADNLRRRVFRPITARVKLPNLTMHGLRHSYATHLLSAGVPLIYVSRQLGHSSPHVTATVYAHWLPVGDRSAVDALDAPQVTTSGKVQSTG